MESLSDAFRAAWTLLVELDADLLEIVGLSLSVTGASLGFACLLGLPAGAALALVRFPGRRVAIVCVNALMGLPPVVVGLVVYLLLSRSGPLGWLGWLFSAKAMVIAQFVLIVPIVTALTRQVVEDLWQEYREQLSSLGATPLRAVPTLLWDARFQLFTTVLAGFGRAIGEVGAVIVVGGNIAHHTRVMTTAIALETRKGDLALALGLGIVLVGLALLVNALASGMRELSARIEGTGG
jgi:tungstate transport system permease protein